MGDDVDPYLEGGQVLAEADDLAFIERVSRDLIGSPLMRERFIALARRGARCKNLIDFRCGRMPNESETAYYQRVAASAE